MVNHVSEDSYKMWSARAFPKTVPESVLLCRLKTGWTFELFWKWPSSHLPIVGDPVLMGHHLDPQSLFSLSHQSALVAGGSPQLQSKHPGIIHVAPGSQSALFFSVKPHRVFKTQSDFGEHFVLARGNYRPSPHCCFGRDSIEVISLKTISTERQKVIVTYD